MGTCKECRWWKHGDDDPAPENYCNNPKLYSSDADGMRYSYDEGGCQETGPDFSCPHFSAGEVIRGTREPVSQVHQATVTGVCTACQEEAELPVRLAPDGFTNAWLCEACAEVVNGSPASETSGFQFWWNPETGEQFFECHNKRREKIRRTYTGYMPSPPAAE